MNDNNLKQLRKGLILRRIRDNKLYFIETVNNDGTYTIRSYWTNTLYGRYTEDQIKRNFDIKTFKPH